MAAKRKASAMAATVDDEPVDPSDELSFLCLGGGNEVGRSCHIIQYKGKTVMVSIVPNELPMPGLPLTYRRQLDAGMHPAKDGYAALPFFDEFDLSTVDVLLLSQYVPCPLLTLILDSQVFSKEPSCCHGQAELVSLSMYFRMNGMFYFLSTTYTCLRQPVTWAGILIHGIVDALFHSIGIEYFR